MHLGPFDGQRSLGEAPRQSLSKNSSSPAYVCLLSTIFSYLYMLTNFLLFFYPIALKIMIEFEIDCY
jgi:hypothetical protein